jgi:carbonic anhydrase/acetyltransferase-like protein (isoleucine patch superfamily)
VLRGDVNRIVIGARSNIQDGTVIHCDSPDPRHPQGFADPDRRGPCSSATWSCCTAARLADRAFVGLGAVVVNGAVIEGDGMLAAGALLTPGKRVAVAPAAGRPPCRLHCVTSPTRRLAEMQLRRTALCRQRARPPARHWRPAMARPKAELPLQQALAGSGR